MVGKIAQTGVVQLKSLIECFFAAIFYISEGNQIIRLCHTVKVETILYG
jgi:hypothetical protein